MEFKYLIIGFMIAIAFMGFMKCLSKGSFGGFLEDEECKHQNTFTSVKNVSLTCETTTVECLDCGKQLREPKTDCS